MSSIFDTVGQGNAVLEGYQNQISKICGTLGPGVSRETTKGVLLAAKPASVDIVNLHEVRRWDAYASGDEKKAQITFMDRVGSVIDKQITWQDYGIRFLRFRHWWIVNWGKDRPI
jgi:hypothetical protein